ncbi:MAG: T9SS type A sorting domain-containing protein [Bacteroidia bacterium]
MRVAKPDNRRDSIYLDINIDITPFGKEPIDSLQDRYDDWKRTVGLEKDILTEKVEVFPQPAQDEVVFYLEKAPAGSEYELTIFDAVGKQLFSQKLQSRRTNINLRSVTGGSAGILIWTISRKGVNVARGKLVKG